jgi:hypothetical protein
MPYEAAIESSGRRAESEARAPQTLTWVASLVIAISTLLVCWNLQETSLPNANTGSRYATVEALIDHGTYAIERTRYRRTIDKVKVGDHFYSSKPPLLPTATAGVYWVYQKLTGHTFVTHESQVVWFCSLITGALPHLLMLIYFFRFLRRWVASELAVLVGMFAIGFASLTTAYATTLNNHTVSATLAVIGFYYAYQAVHAPERGRKPWILSGVCLGLLPGVDIPASAVSAAIGIYLLVADRRKTLTWFALGALPGLVLHFALTYASTGSLVPAYMRKELYAYPGSYWLRPAGIDALQEPKWLYAFNTLLGHHGLFSMTPLFVFAGIALVRALRKRSPAHATARRREAWVVAGASGVLIAFYILYTSNYGGWCVGFRYWVVLMPLLFLFFAAWVDDFVHAAKSRTAARWVWSLVLAGFLVSQYHVLDGLRDPWQFSNWHKWLRRNFPATQQ